MWPPPAAAWRRSTWLPGSSRAWWAIDEARSAMHYVAPVGEKEDYVERAMRNIAPFVQAPLATA
jgi:hypothetical protein